MFFLSEIPFVRILLAYCSGIILAIYFPNQQFYNGNISLILCLLTLLHFLVLLYKRLLVFRKPWMAGWVVNVLLFVLAYHYTVRTTQRYDTFHFSNFKLSYLMAQVVDEPLVKNGFQRFSVRVLSGLTGKELKSLRGSLLVSAGPDSIFENEVKYGDVLLLPGDYSAIEPPYNPGEFNYSLWLSYRQIYHQLYIASSDYQIIKSDQGNPIIAGAINLRKSLVANYESFVPDQQSASLASALILGYRADMNKELVQTYANTGTIHVLSVSGMHVALIFVVISKLLGFMDRNSQMRLIRALLIVAIIWLYAMLTGFSAPANRAACMISFIVIGKAINRSQNNYNLLAIAAFLLLLYNPFYLVDMGFQLSFAAVLGLFYFQAPIADLLNFKGRLLFTVWKYISLSLAAQLATFPLAVFYFHQFPVYFLLSNLFIVVPVSMIMYLGLLLLIIPIGNVQQVMGLILSEMIELTNSGLKFIEDLPLSSISGIWLESYELFIISMIFLFFILRTFNYRMALDAALGLILLLCCCLSFKKLSSYFTSDLLLYSLNKNAGLAFSQTGQSIVISDLPKDHITIHNSILPGIQSRGYSIDIMQGYNQTGSGPGYYCRPGFMQFRNFKVLRWNPGFDKKKFLGSLFVDALLLAENARTPLAEIRKHVNFNQLYIEATCSNYTISRYYEEALSLKIPVYVLKKNPSKIIKL